MNEIKFTQEHEWILIEEKAIGVVGITDYAQQQLGDIVFVELPEVGKEINQGDDVAVIESVKAASELNTPISGEIIEINQVLNDAPETINNDPMGTGWIMKIKIADSSELEGLMDEQAYKNFLVE
ncbi:MAG: glycine cleavage system protein GcvH [Gammaproteobacteria bacterium]|jgi:glycine cleavage system H protein|nr:glycine cleavage system protein GcvH [Gammaproteobacteria bacterium]